MGPCRFATSGQASQSGTLPKAKSDIRINASGKASGAADAENELIYVAQTKEGQETLRREDIDDDRWTPWQNLFNGRTLEGWQQAAKA